MKKADEDVEDVENVEAQQTTEKPKKKPNIFEDAFKLKPIPKSNKTVPSAIPLHNDKVTKRDLRSAEVIKESVAITDHNFHSNSLNKQDFLKVYVKACFC